VAIVRTGDYSGAAVVADRALDLALREGSPASLAAAYHGKLQTQYYKGDLAGTEALFALWRNFQGTDDAGNIASAPIVLGFASWCALQMGRIETARERIAEAVATAHANKEPFAQMIGGIMEAMFYRLLREPARVEAAANQSLVLVQQHDLIGPNLFPFKGWARAQLGSTAEGVSLVRQALADPNMRIGGIWFDAYLCLAEAQILDGKLDDAMVTIEQALQANSQEVVLRPEMLRIRGELRQRIGDPEAAETDLREAVALLQKMGARMWELRATTSLARLLRDTNRRGEARAMLADIYNWFTEGFDTADLKDAKALLDELNV
jgi:predicted ATPase